MQQKESEKWMSLDAKYFSHSKYEQNKMKINTIELEILQMFEPLIVYMYVVFLMWCTVVGSIASPPTIETSKTIAIRIMCVFLCVCESLRGKICKGFQVD